ncbi:MAG TPA: serine/threonine-protein kinase [Myxococcaceae bacterium]|nr:serine/threonine-protein kinase [Myxococcaceae bacterium]
MSPVSSPPSSSDEPRRPIAAAAGREALPRGATIGRYLILRQLGEGGMGIVYAAFDPELDRKIALKVLRPARRAASGSVAQVRMLREAQAMARISHPNVVTVHDVGAHGDEIFIAMELVEGGTLTDWVEARPRKLDELLRTFVEAGRGLAAAHHAGLVHRDFKPENVLVGGDGRVRVTDFGLARLDELSPLGAGVRPPSSLSSPALTQDGAIVGTPLFMSPEQAHGKIPDARSDQYGFCSSLYWAIYGKPAPSPFSESGDAMPTVSLTKDSEEAMATDSSVQEPPSAPGAPRPLQLPREPKLPSNVRRALLRGLSWDAAGRYPSMDELLAELAPGGALVTRWRTLALAGVAAAVVAGAVGVRAARRPAELCTGAERRLTGIWDDGARAAVNASFASADATAGPEAAGRVVVILDRYARAWATTHVEACEATRLRGEQTEAILSLRMICLDRRLHQLGALANQFKSADAKLVQKAVDAALSLTPLSSCDAAAQSLTAEPPKDPRVRARIDEIGRQLDEVRALMLAGRYKAGLAAAEKGIAAADQVDYWPVRAEALYLQGQLLDVSGSAENAEKVLQKAVLAADAARSDHDKIFALARLVHVEGCGLRKFEESRYLAEVARAEVSAIGSDELEFELNYRIGNSLRCQIRTTEALEPFRRALDLADRAVGPGNPQKGMLLSNMADVYAAIGRPQDALPLLRQALLILSTAKGADHPDTAFVHYNLSESLRRTGDTKGAYEEIQQAIRIWKAALGPDHPLVADALDRLALTLIEDGLFAEALVECQRSLAIREKALGKEHPDVSYSLENLGAALIGVHQPEKAISALERAIAIRSKESVSAEDLAEPRFSLARALWDAGKDRARAKELAEQARGGYLQGGQKQEAEKVSAWISAH